MGFLPLRIISESPRTSMSKALFAQILGPMRLSPILSPVTALGGNRLDASVSPPAATLGEPRWNPKARRQGSLQRLRAPGSGKHSFLPFLRGRVLWVSWPHRSLWILQKAF